MTHWHDSLESNPLKVTVAVKFTAIKRKLCSANQSESLEIVTHTRGDREHNNIYSLQSYKISTLLT